MQSTTEPHGRTKQPRSCDGRGSTDPSERKRWLLIKHRDQHADPSWDIESLELDHSVHSAAR